MYGKELTENEVRFWKDELRHLPANVIEVAFRQHMRTNEFFPKPTHILTFAAGMQQPRPTYQPPTQAERLAVEAYQASPEYDQDRARFEALLQQIVSKAKMEKSIHLVPTAEELAKQTRELREKMGK